jgi:hypothetical protein
MLVEDIILDYWWSARYVPESIAILNDFDTVDLDSKVKSHIFLNSLLKVASDPKLEEADPRFPNYKLPKTLLSDNERVRDIVVDRVIKLLEIEKLSWNETKKFLIENHENIKRLQNRWFAANPGLLLEWVKITDDYQKLLIDWLSKQGLSLGDDTIHLHVISNNGRKNIRQMGFDVPYDHWDESYYKNMLSKCVEIMEMHPQVKGLYCDASWVHNPRNFEIAPDGKPFVSFDFLKDTNLIGETIDITNCMSQGDYQTQFNFASRSPRRKQYIDEGVYEVRVVASFYSREKLIANKSLFD